MPPIHNRPTTPEHRSPEWLRANGPLLRVIVSPPNGSHGVPDILNPSNERSRDGLAMIDTGASHTCVERRVLEELGLNPIGFADAATPAGWMRPAVYKAHLSLPDEDLEFELAAAAAIDFGAPPRDSPAIQLPIVLLGRDLLSGIQFAYDGPGGLFTLTV